MYHRWAALWLAFALCAIPTKKAAGQSSTSQPPRKPGVLGQNYPNPFNPETSIPFSIDCAGGSGVHTVTLRVFNVLAQLIAIPKLDGPATPIEKLKLSCGDYIARWDGKVLNTPREAASGVYFYELIIDGFPQARKMLIAK
ncbi:MAG: hypothetical protein ABJE47_25780 [bacterium]